MTAVPGSSVFVHKYNRIKLLHIYTCYIGRMYMSTHTHQNPIGYIQIHMYTCTHRCDHCVWYMYSCTYIYQNPTIYIQIYSAHIHAYMSISACNCSVFVLQYVVVYLAYDSLVMATTICVAWQLQYVLLCITVCCCSVSREVHVLK